MKDRLVRFLAEDALTLLLAFGAAAILTAVCWSSLPLEVPIHWNWAGEADSFASRGVAVLLTPLGAVVSYLFVTGLLALDSRADNVERARDTFGLFRVVTPLMLLGLHVMMLFTWLDDSSFDFVTMVYVGSGVLYAVMGNYMPRLKSNFVIGIRLPWTLDDEEVWRRTHRMAGPLWLIGGLSLLGTGLLPNSLQLAYFCLVSAILAIVPSVFAYQLYQRRHPRANG